MDLSKFERMLTRAGFRLLKVYDQKFGEERRIYVQPSIPLLNVRVRDNTVDEYDALKVRAYLDEEGLLD